MTTLPGFPPALADAAWLWNRAHECDLHHCFVRFRHGFELPAVPKKAPLLITADRSYELWVNGVFAGRGPARGFQLHWPYDEIDVAPLLKKGRNVLAVRAYHPGLSNFQYRTEGSAGLIVGARWGAVRIASGGAWRCVREQGVNRGTVPASLMLPPQEHRDARLDPDHAEWTKPGFDDSAWDQPACRRAGTPPWHALEARGIPQLREERVAPVALLGEEHGPGAEGWRTARDVTLLRASEGLAHQPSKAGGPAVLKIPATGDDGRRSYLLDFGRTVVGHLRLSVRGAKGGEAIDSLHTESIDHDTLAPHYQVKAWCEMRFGSRLVCRPGATTHAFHQAYGFRYLDLTVRGSTAPLEIEVALDRVGYPLDTVGAFAHSDPQLEAIWRTCAWTQQCCMLDAYVDTPWREQAQWWGDARVQAANTFHLVPDARLLRRGIAQIAAQTTADGVTYGHSPTIAHNCVLPDFSLTWMLTVWDHWWQTGSAEAFLAHRDRVDGLFAYFRQRTDPRSGLLTYDPRYWLFLDWAQIPKEGCPATYSLWLLIALERMAELAGVVRDRAAAAEWLAWAKRLRRSLAALSDGKGRLRDGIDARGKPYRSTGAHAQVLGLMAGVPGIDAEAAMEPLRAWVRGDVEQKPDHPSSFWSHYVFAELARRGHGDEVVDCIRRRWSHYVDHGTTFEGWGEKPPCGDGSRSHAWTAHPLVHLAQILGGVRQLAPAWTRIAFAPVLAGERCAVAVPTPRGAIRAEWSRTGDRIAARLRLPAGITAEVALPGDRRRIVRGGTWSGSVPA